MTIQSKAELLQLLIDQLSADSPLTCQQLRGPRSPNGGSPADLNEVLLGLRDLHTLGWIDGQLTYAADSDPQGQLLSSAEGLVLTKRGALFKSIY